MSQSRLMTVRLHPDDNVVVAAVPLNAGDKVDEEGILCRDPVPQGHKVATRDMKKGDIIRKYGQIIGAASQDIRAGEHVHVRNMKIVSYDREYFFGKEARPTAYVPEKDRAFFQGIVRDDGRIATRNYIGIIASVSCSASVVRFIADAFDPDYLAKFPNVDGVVSIVHGSGCGIADHGEGIEYLQKTMMGWARHPNFAGILLVGHGCEINQITDLAEMIGPDLCPAFQMFDVQGTGGTKKALQRGVEEIKAMLPAADQITRQPVPASNLIVGLECGGSDAFSGITANPALGVASDLLVQNGGTVILSETTEIYGAEQLLVRRTEKEETAQKLLERVRWWEENARHHGIELDNNPSPGNKAGGLTTILEKSLGAVAKSGTSNLVEVYRYADPVTAKGLVFMDTPGYDMVSVTGMIAGGANLICFTTGRGSVFGSKPVPTIKLVSNSQTFHSMEEDMDVNCGRIIDGEAGIEEVGREIFQRILDTASGRKTKSELLGFGDNEFVPWHLGAIL